MPTKLSVASTCLPAYRLYREDRPLHIDDLHDALEFADEKYDFAIEDYWGWRGRDIREQFRCEHRIARLCSRREDLKRLIASYYRWHDLSERIRLAQRSLSGDDIPI